MTALTLFPPCMEKGSSSFPFTNYIALHFTVRFTSTQNSPLMQNQILNKYDSFIYNNQCLIKLNLVLRRQHSVNTFFVGFREENQGRG